LLFSFSPFSKLNLGIGAYGRSWTLANKANSGLGAAAYSPGSAGQCTGEAGYIGWAEIKQLIANGAQVCGLISVCLCVCLGGGGGSGGAGARGGGSAALPDA
jgi:hypothetical protein